jgi:hypothetical protein
LLEANDAVVCPITCPGINRPAPAPIAIPFKKSLRVIFKAKIIP